MILIDPMVAIRQTDHAFLAGFFAREFGNEIFKRPEPSASFCLAIAEHDNGWQEWELEPALGHQRQARVWERQARIYLR
jgi:hypothetical protein